MPETPRLLGEDHKNLVRLHDGAHGIEVSYSYRILTRPGDLYQLCEHHLMVKTLSGFYSPHNYRRPASVRPKFAIWRLYVIVLAPKSTIILRLRHQVPFGVADFDIRTLHGHIIAATYRTTNLIV